MFEAYITNTALYPLMGIEVGTTVHFPTTTQELQAALAKIGIPQAWQAGWLCAAVAGPDRKAESKHGGKLAERPEAL